MKKIDNSIDKLREKKKRFIAREIAIRDSAISLLKEKGLESVTISLIADHACIGKGTIYKHFLSKTEILMRKHEKMYLLISQRFILNLKKNFK